MSLHDTLARQLVTTGLRLSLKLPGRLPLPLPMMRAGMEQSAHLFKPHPAVRADSDHLGGISALRLTPPRPSRRVLLHLHGGAFFAGSAASHQALGSELAMRAQATVWLPDYRRAPEHPCPAAFEDARAAYEGLLATGHVAEDIVLGGDSAGSALALALCLHLRDRGQPMPAGLMLMSPFLDLRLCNPSITLLAGRDPMLSKRALQRGADAYRGDIPADDPRVSPGLAASLAQLPPTLVQVGSEEILLDDSLNFCGRARNHGSRVTCQLLDGLWHNAAMFADVVPSADDALERLAAFVRNPVHD